MDVYDVTYKRHAKPGKTPTLWVKYLAQFEEYSEWICFEHEGFALDKARVWWLQRAQAHPMPRTVTEAANVAPRLPKPSRIKVKQDGKYWRVLDYDFTPVERQPAIIEEERSYAF